MLADRIKKRFPSLTPQQKRIADHFLSIGHEAAFFTTSQVARQFNTSESTIVRFARALGYAGYPDLQADLQETIRRKLSPPKALEKSRAKDRGKDIYRPVFEMDHENLRRTRELNPVPTLNRAVRQMIAARKVGVTGVRTSHSVAYLLYFLLGQVRENCHLLEFRGGSLPNQIISYGPRDLVIGISLPRYSRQTLAILNYAKGKRCRTLAITDSPISPLGQVAEGVLLVGNQSSTYFNSLASAVTLVNCLVAGVSLKNRKALETLNQVNQAATDWDYLLM